MTVPQFDSREFYDARAASYDVTMDTKSNRRVRQRVQKLLVRYAPGAGAVLDFGCGTGGDVAAFLEQGRRVLAYDPSPGMLAQLCSRYVEAIRLQRVVPITGGLEDLNAGISGFEPVRAVVANFGSINHVPRLAIFTDLMARLTSLQAVILGVQNPLFLPDMRSRWWWRGLRAGRGQGAILCQSGAVTTRRYFVRTLAASMAPDFQLRASYDTWAPMRLLAFERVA
jgi:SAM-dependent methyltransferase